MGNGQVRTPTGRTYSVRRRWLAWRQRIPLDTELVVTLLAAVELTARTVLAPVAVLLRALRVVPWEIEVRDLGARRGRSVTRRERVRGWAASQQLIRSVVRDLEEQHVDPDATDFAVVVTRSPVSMGDDTDDNTRVYGLDDRTSPPTLATLVTAIRDRGPFVSISGTPTTWALRESGTRKRFGRPVAVFVLGPGRDQVDVHTVADTSFRIARGARFHLEYLLTQSVERTLELIAEDPSGRRTLREDTLRLLRDDPPD